MYKKWFLFFNPFQTFIHVGDFYRQKFQLHPGWAQTVLFCSDLKQNSHQKIKKTRLSSNEKK